MIKETIITKEAPKALGLSKDALVEIEALAMI